MRTIPAVISAIIILAAASCTHNDGNIGSLFGQWKLVSMICEGEPIAQYNENVYWSFQSQTIEMKEVVASHEVYQTFGNYKLTDNTLLLSFPDKDFPPRPITGLPREAAMQVLSLSSSRMVLAHGTPDTIYTFHKW